MAIKRPDPLVRTNYLDPSQPNYGIDGNPDSAGFTPENVLPRTQDIPVIANQVSVSLGESKVDMEQYYRPLEAVHGGGLHGTGVAWGLQVSAVVGVAGVKIAPGVALTPSGRHAYLASGGQAEIGPTADAQGVNPNSATVTASGVTLPTAGFIGDAYVSIQWWETFDSASFLNSGGDVAQFGDTPWLRLLKLGNYDPDVHVILAKVTLDAQNKVTALNYGDVGGVQRRSVTLPAQAVLFSRAVNAGGPSADSAEFGELRSREGGGLELLVSNATDHLDVARTKGGGFSQMNVVADELRIGPNGSPSIVLDSKNAWIRAGTTGNEGDVEIVNAQNKLTISLNGSDAHAVLGAVEVPGQVRVLGNGGQDTINLNGVSGAAVVKSVDAWGGQRLDVNAQFTEVHGQLQVDGLLEARGSAQVDSQLNVAGDPIFGGLVIQEMDAFPSQNQQVTTHTIDLGKPCEFFATVTMNYLAPENGFDSDNIAVVEIFMIDGGMTQPIWSQGKLGPSNDPGNTRPGMIRGFGQQITFRCRALGPDLEVGAWCAVHFQR